MRLLVIKQKHKLSRLLGREIWGNLIKKYNVFYLKRYPYKDLGRICNYVVLEHERRNLFDFRQKFRIFRPKRKTDSDYFESRKKQMRIWWRRRLRKRFSRLDHYFYKRKQTYFPIFREGINEVSNRFSRFSSFWIGYITIMRLFLKLRRRKLRRILRLKARYGEKLRPQRLPKKIFALFRRSWDLRWIHLQNKQDKRLNSLKQRFQTQKSKLRSKAKPLAINFLHTPYAPHHERSWAFSYNRFRSRRTKRAREFLKKARKFIKFGYVNKPVTHSKSLRPPVLQSIDPEDEWWKQPKLGVSSLQNWLLTFFYTFPTKLIRPKFHPLRIMRLYNYRAAPINKPFVLPKIITLQSKITLSLLLDNWKQFILTFRSITLLRFSIDTERTYNYLIAKRYGILSYINLPFFGCAIQRNRQINSRLGFIVQKRIRRTIRSVYRRKKLGWLIYKLLDRRDILLQLKYTVVRLRLGDYEEGFRIPYAPSDSRTRAKRQYRRLELLRRQLFYGIFDANAFKQRVFEFMRYYKNNTQRVFTLLLECRPIFLLYLTNPFPSMYFIDQFIQHRNLVRDDLICIDAQSPMRIGEPLIIPNEMYWRFLNTLIFKLLHFKVLLNVPNFMEMNYIVLALAVISIPRKQQWTMPFLSKLATFDRYSLIKTV